MAVQKTQQQLEDEARDWIEAITGEEFSDSSNFAESTRDGVLLCKCVRQLAYLPCSSCGFPVPSLPTIFCPNPPPPSPYPAFPPPHALSRAPLKKK